MIARFRCTLPSLFALRPSDQLGPLEVVREGTRCRLFPPFQVRRVDGSVDLRGEPAAPQVPTDMTIDGEPTFFADAIQVDLYGEFDRSDGGNAADVTAIAFPVLQAVLGRLRCLGRAFFMQTTAEGSSWYVQYLSDAGEELQPQAGFVRGRGSASVEVPPFMWIAPEQWQALQVMVTAPAPPPSDELLLDALDALPHVGAAVVLAYTAIEVRIASALNVLATNNRAVVAPEIWAWINKREQFLKEPSVEEQLTDLMQMLAGKSLKTEAGLWAAYGNLRKARNSFAHEGNARLLDRTLVTREKANELILGATAIIAWIEAALPIAVRCSPSGG
jgi:hypothetical protein